MICERSVKTFCKDFTKIENYEEAINDSAQIWHCHHRNEKFYTKQELIDLGLYYDCPPSELIFLTRKNHFKEFHKGRCGRTLSEETKEKISESLKGISRKPFSEEHKRKISLSKKNPKNSTKIKMSIAKKGRHWRLVNGKRKWYDSHESL